MITHSVTLVRLFRCVAMANRLMVWAAYFMGGVALCALLFCSYSGRKTGASNRQERLFKESKVSLLKGSLSQGAMRLEREGVMLSLLGVLDRLELVGKNTRPDARATDVHFHIGLREGSSIKTTSENIFYLAFSPDNEGSFEETLSPLSIKPSLSSKGEVNAELQLQVVDPLERVIKEEKQQITLEEKPSQRAPERDDLFFRAVGALREAKWWGMDVLFGVYGGETYGSLKDCERIECVEGRASAFLYARQGDVFSWDGAKWERSELGERTRGMPLARVEAVSQINMRWSIWDTSGLKREEVIQTKEKGQPLTIRPESFFSRIRRRTATSISCHIEKKSIVLKEGDWLFQGKSGWKVLRNLQEIKDVLDFKLIGNLFVFDGLEENKGAQTFLGTFFNAERTHKQDVKLPITHKKKKQHSTHLKKSHSSKIQRALPKEPLKKKKSKRKESPTLTHQSHEHVEE